MATERQIQANRANAAKSTGPVTAEGKRASSQNAARPNLVASTVVLKGESMRRFNDLASALMLQFKPRNPAETFLVQTMTAARWRLLRMWGIQTAGFESEMALEMARANRNSGPSAGPGAVLAAVTFRNLADNSKALALQLRYEAAYDRQYNRALTLLLKLRQAPEPGVQVDPPLQVATETWDDDSPNEPNFDAGLGEDPTCNEQVPDIAPNAPPLETNPISPPGAGTRADAQDGIHPTVTASPVIAPNPCAKCGLDRRRANQPLAHAQFASNIVDYSMNIQAALEPPRFTRKTSTGCDVSIESRVPLQTLQRLSERGHQIAIRKEYTIVRRRSPDPYRGEVMAVHYDIGSMIASTPTINAGRPSIAGTGMNGYSPAEVVADRPYLTLAQVHAALAYYRANQAEIGADLAADEEYLGSHPPNS